MFSQFLPLTDPVPIFAILLLTALAAPLLAQKIKLPGIIGLIIAGIIIGPHGLEVLEYIKSGRIVGNEVNFFARIGLLYLMFLAGMELDLDQFIRHKNHSIIFGAFTFGIPLVFGSLMGYYLLNFSWPASILLASMFSSHTLITYPVASRLGLTRHRAVTTTIGGTLITDTAALLVLAVIAALHKGEAGVFFWGRMLTHMVIYIAAVIMILPKLGRWFFQRIATDGIIAYTGVAAAVFICASLAHVAGLEPIIGAFLAGLTLNSLIPENSTLMNRIQFVGHSLFIPFFLISVGMLVNVKLLFTGGDAIIIAASMVFAGIVTKYGASSASRRILSYTHEEGMLIYGLSVNQAAATLAAVMVGYNIGIFSEHVVTGTVIMILVTSLSGSWITDRYARKVALSEEDKPYSPADAPHRILIPLANPNTAEELMDLAKFIRKKNSHEPLHPLSVVESGDNTEERIAGAEKLLGNAVVKAISADIPVSPVTRSATSTSSGILQAITDLRISTAIFGWKGKVASHSHTFGRKLDAIIEKSRQMILVSNYSQPINTFKRVVLAAPPLIEHQEGFETAVRAVKTLTQQLGASLLTVSVPPTFESVHKIIEANPPKLQENDILLEHWNNLLPWLKDSISPRDDLLVLFNVRKGRLAWRPNLSKMPRLIKDSIEDINLVVVFPPEMPWKGPSETQKIQAPACLSLLPPEHIMVGLKDSGIEESISTLLKSAFPQQDTILEKLTKLLSRMSETEPMELSPGVVLLHAHIPHVEGSTAFLGINKSGWSIPHTSKKVKALFILLSPKDASPEMHLKALAKIVGPLHRTRASEKIIKADSVNEVLKIFGEAESRGKIGD